MGVCIVLGAPSIARNESRVEWRRTTHHCAVGEWGTVALCWVTLWSGMCLACVCCLFFVSLLSVQFDCQMSAREKRRRGGCAGDAVIPRGRLEGSGAKKATTTTGKATTPRRPSAGCWRSLPSWIVTGATARRDVLQCTSLV